MPQAIRPGTAGSPPLPGNAGRRATTAILQYTDNDRTYLVFLVSVPSNPAHRTGYCGAGYEDTLVSARINGDRLRLTDRLLIQRCRESLTLEGGPTDDIGRALAVDIELHEVRLRRESSAHGTVIRMRSGTFLETTAPDVDIHPTPADTAGLAPLSR